jgi:hypothetical protein
VCVDLSRKQPIFGRRKRRSKMRSKFAVFFVLISGFLAITETASTASQLKLVAAQSLNAPAAFVTTEAVTYDANYIYAASAQGVLVSFR